MPGTPVMMKACCHGANWCISGQFATAPRSTALTSDPPSRNTMPAPMTPPITKIDMARLTRAGGKLSPSIE